jgi:hypothetical protein
VTLVFCRDLSVADWIADSDLPWHRLVSFGPAVFDAYARLRFLPDPARPGQSENEVTGEDWRAAQWPTVLEVLATQTATPNDCYFCVWEGFGHAHAAIDDDAVYIDAVDSLPPEQAGAQPALAPRLASDHSMPHVPKVVVQERAYWLFRGPLTDVGTWDTAHGWPGQCRLYNDEPAFVWPSDRAWCIANDVDPHYAGIGASSRTIDQLLAHPSLDVVTADPQVKPPEYR